MQPRTEIFFLSFSFISFFFVPAEELMNAFAQCYDYYVDGHYYYDYCIYFIPFCFVSNSFFFCSVRRQLLFVYAGSAARKKNRTYMMHRRHQVNEIERDMNFRPCGGHGRRQRNTYSSLKFYGKSFGLQWVDIVSPMSNSMFRNERMCRMS